MSLQKAVHRRRPHGKGITAIAVFAALDLLSRHGRHTSGSLSQGREQSQRRTSSSSSWPGVEAVQSHHLPPRTHCLTPPPSEASDEELEVCEQTQSPMFKLPLELLCLIYEEIIGNRTIHVVRRRGEKLGHTLCRCDSPPCQQQCKGDQCRGVKLPTGTYVISGPGNGGIIQLLQSCRKVYADAIQVLYGSNVFDFDSMESLISFSTAILPKRFHSIKHLQLDFRFSMSFYFSESTAQDDPPRWERTWRIIGSMKALQDLWVWISWHRLDFGPVEEARLLEKLDQVRQLRTFEVSLPSLKGLEVKKKREEQLFHVVRRA